MTLSQIITTNDNQKAGYADMVLAMGDKVRYNEPIKDIWQRIRYIRQLQGLYDTEIVKVGYDKQTLIGCVNYINYLLAEYKREADVTIVDYTLLTDYKSQSVSPLRDLLFIDLYDTPSVIEPLKLLRGKADGSGLEFVESPKNEGGGSFDVWTIEDAEAGKYDIDSFVSHISKIWKSLINNNQVEPSLSATAEWEAQSVETLANAVLLEDVVWSNPDLGKSLPVTSPIGMSFTEAWKQLTQKIFYPTLNAPSFSLSKNTANLLKIGSTVDVGLTFNFNRGSIVLQGVTQNPRAGVANSYILNGNVQGANTRTIAGYTVAQGTNTFTGTVSYDQGSQPKDSVGADYGTPFPAGTSPTQSTSFEGVYPLYATTSNITTATEQPLVNMNTANNVQISLVAESGGNKQFFDIPDAWLTARPLTSVQYFNALSGQFDTTNKIGDFAVTSVNNTVQGDAIGYKRRTYTGADRGSLLIRLIF